MKHKDLKMLLKILIILSIIAAITYWGMQKYEEKMVREAKQELVERVKEKIVEDVLPEVLPEQE